MPVRAGQARLREMPGALLSATSARADPGGDALCRPPDVVEASDTQPAPLAAGSPCCENKSLTPPERDLSFSRNYFYGREYPECSGWRTSSEERDWKGPTEEGNRPHQFAAQALGGSDHQAADLASGRAFGRASDGSGASRAGCGNLGTHGRSTGCCPCAGSRCRCPGNLDAAPRSLDGSRSPRSRSVGYEPGHRRGGGWHPRRSDDAEQHVPVGVVARGAH